MLEQLQNHLLKVVKKIKGQGKISESNISDTLRDIRIALLEADVSLSVVKKFIKQVKEKSLGKEVLNSILPAQQFIKILHDELKFFLGSEESDLLLDSSSMTIIVLAGLQGCGKTTTSAKLARFLKKNKDKKPYLIAADLQRPAAIDQLVTLGEKIEVEVYQNKNTKDPVKVVQDGIKEAKINKKDVVIIDTAGRLHVDDDMMGELKTIVDVSSPTEILFVSDGMSGQDAVLSSKAFSDAIDITGIILTKMDGDSKGGAALSIKDVVQKPIKFIGIGENINDLDKFYPDRFASRILDMGDVVSLVEKAQSAFDMESVENLERNLKNQKFSLVDFQEQLKQIQNMGSLSNVMKMIPGASKLKLKDFDEKNIKWVEAIISSMTSEEKLNPSIINGSRKKRIAKGCGRPVQEVNRLLKQYNQMKIMMKKINNGKMNFPFLK